MQLIRRRRLAGAISPIAVIGALAAIGLVGCGGLRLWTRTASSPALPPVQVGQVTRDQLLSAAGSANVVICVLDAARADHVGCYGYPRPTTPNIDGLAKESVLFRNHFSIYPSTKPSTASLFTGLYPDTHRIIERRGLEAATFTLAKGLKGAGFHTAFFSSNAVASPEAGNGGDFERVFVMPSARGQAKEERIGLPDDETWRTPEGLTEVFGRWLSGERKSRFLAYCHFLPPHNPYDAPDELKALFATGAPPAVESGRFEFPETRPSYGRPAPHATWDWANLYDANMRWADWGVGEVVRLLRGNGVLDNTLLIITADHGEAFGEHGYIFHSNAVYDEFVHIPLLIRFPGPQRLVGEVTALTQTVDVLPTVCDLSRTAYPKSVQGRSLLPLLDGEKHDRQKHDLRDFVFATSGKPWPSYLVRNSEWSLMLWRGGKLRALYDLRADPRQKVNVIDAHPEVAATMVAAFEKFAATQGRSLAEFVSPQAAAAAEAQAAAAPQAPKGRLSEKTRRELRALGYVE